MESGKFEKWKSGNRQIVKSGKSGKNKKMLEKLPIHINLPIFLRKLHNLYLKELNH